MGKMKATETSETPPPALIVFGKDEAGRPHASWFAEADAALAERAAGLMAMSALRVIADDHRAIALELPQGRVFESGRGLVPFTKAATYERLSALPGAFQPPLPVAEESDVLPEVSSVPSRWDDIAVGALVLANDGDQPGWYESVVIEDKGEALLVLRWRDWPEQPAFVRRRDHLGLLPLSASDPSENKA